MKKLYTAWSGEKLVTVGTDPDHLNDGIAAWHRVRPKRGAEPKITILKQQYRVHPRWMDDEYFAHLRERIDTR